MSVKVKIQQPGGDPTRALEDPWIGSTLSHIRHIYHRPFACLRPVVVHNKNSILISYDNYLNSVFFFQEIPVWAGVALRDNQETNPQRQNLIAKPAEEIELRDIYLAAYSQPNCFGFIEKEFLKLFYKLTLELVFPEDGIDLLRKTSYPNKSGSFPYILSGSNKIQRVIYGNSLYKFDLATEKLFANYSSDALKTKLNFCFLDLFYLRQKAVPLDPEQFLLKGLNRIFSSKDFNAVTEYDSLGKLWTTGIFKKTLKDGAPFVASQFKNSSRQILENKPNSWADSFPKVDLKTNQSVFIDLLKVVHANQGNENLIKALEIITTIDHQALNGKYNFLASQLLRKQFVDIVGLEYISQILKVQDV